jgi:hypothetical protein
MQTTGEACGTGGSLLQEALVGRQRIWSSQEQVSYISHDEKVVEVFVNLL